MTWVKICGTTNLEDARAATDAGADALGFVFYEKSPRYIDPAAVNKIVAKLPPGIEKVGVFVEQPLDRVREIVTQAGLTAVQLHAESYLGRMEEVVRLKKHAPSLKLIVVFPAAKLTGTRPLFDSDETKQMFHALMLDSFSATQPGGTGKTFDWTESRGAIRTAAKLLPVIVAGGLNPLNVREAIRILQPYGVDVASGVEREPGRKDPDKVRAFVRAVRDAEKEKTA